MAPKPPGRLQAKLIPDLEMLEVLEMRGRLPAEWFDEFPLKVVREKLTKLFDRGLIRFDHEKGLMGGSYLTNQGKIHLAGLQRNLRPPVADATGSPS